MDAANKRVLTSNLQGEVIAVGTESGKVDQLFSISAEQPMNQALDPSAKCPCVANREAGAVAAYES